MSPWSAILAHVEGGPILDLRLYRRKNDAEGVHHLAINADRHYVSLVRLLRPGAFSARTGTNRYFAVSFISRGGIGSANALATEATNAIAHKNRSHFRRSHFSAALIRL